MGRVESIGNERSDGATREERSDDGERGEIADVDHIGGEDLDPDEAEDERDRLVEIAEPAHEQLDENEQGAEPEEGEAFAVQMTTGSRVTAKAAGIESTAKAMSARMIATTTSSSGVP